MAKRGDKRAGKRPTAAGKPPAGAGGKSSRKSQPPSNRKPAPTKPAAPAKSSGPSAKPARPREKARRAAQAAIQTVSRAIRKAVVVTEAAVTGKQQQQQQERRKSSSTQPMATSTTKTAPPQAQPAPQTASQPAPTPVQPTAAPAPPAEPSRPVKAATVVQASETPEQRSTDRVPAGQATPPATPVVIGVEDAPPVQAEIVEPAAPSDEQPAPGEAPAESAAAPTPAATPDQPPAAPPPPPPPSSTGPETPFTPREAPIGGNLPLLFECAWEVCWQLGGIYTVLRTKVPATAKQWDDRYFLIGPYNPSTAALEFEEQPTEGFIRTTLDRLRHQGIPCHYGRWLIPGRPRVILLDYRARFRSLDLDKYLMWQDHGISTPPNDGEVNEVVAFGFTVAEFFKELTDVVRNRPILGHFHEWMGGVAVPRIAHLRLPMTTVFTTHATLLGRYLASDSPDFYNHLPFIHPETEAGKYNIMPRHLIEKAAAHASTVFTTVSEVTAFEAEKLLGRAPDAILPNGLNIHRFAAIHEFQNLHRQYKEKIHEFVMGHFFPAYTMDLDNTLYLFTSGRYEYRNKGMDLFIEAMVQLNQRLRGVKDAPNVVSFIITRAATRNINVGVLQNQSMFDELRNTCEQLQEQMGKRLFEAAANGRLPTMPELLTDDAQVRLKRAIHAWRSGRQPTVVTHDLVDDGNDPILRHVRHRGLFNAADDPVKVVFHPEFVTSTSPLINLDYDQFVRGCHMGIFPSYYEPWGYTPMETIAMGLPTVTTDLSGFGAYVKRHIEHNEEQGVLVLDRRYRGFDDAVTQLVDYLMEFIQLNRRQRIELRNRAERLSELFDWSELIHHYNEAHNLALERIGQRPGVVEVRVVG